jgi:hypothetical protein
MTADVTVAHWQLILRPRTTPQKPLGEYAGCPPGRLPLPGQAPEPATLTGEFLLADAGCASPWADIADILVVRLPPGSRDQCAPRHWLASVLARHPGCAVAVTGGAAWWTALARAGTVITPPMAGGGPLTAPGHGYLAAAAMPAVPVDLAAAGCLVHALLVARWPLTPLTSARSRLTAPGPPGSWTSCGQAAGAPFSFGIVLEDLETGRSPSSRA